MLAGVASGDVAWRARGNVVGQRTIDAPGALEEADDLERDGAEQGKLAVIRCRAIGHGANRSHDVLGVSRLEELNRVERVMHLGEVALVQLGGGWRCLLARTAQHARGVTSR